MHRLCHPHMRAYGEFSGRGILRRPLVISVPQSQRLLGAKFGASFQMPFKVADGSFPIERTISLLQLAPHPPVPCMMLRMQVLHLPLERHCCSPIDVGLRPSGTRSQRYYARHTPQEHSRDQPRPSVTFSLVKLVPVRVMGVDLLTAEIRNPTRAWETLWSGSEIGVDRLATMQHTRQAAKAGSNQDHCVNSKCYATLPFQGKLFVRCLSESHATRLCQSLSK